MAWPFTLLSFKHKKCETPGVIKRPVPSKGEGIRPQDETKKTWQKRRVGPGRRKVKYYDFSITEKKRKMRKMCNAGALDTRETNSNTAGTTTSVDFSGFIILFVSCLQVRSLQNRRYCARDTG